MSKCWLAVTQHISECRLEFSASNFGLCIKNLLELDSFLNLNSQAQLTRRPVHYLLNNSQQMKLLEI